MRVVSLDRRRNCTAIALSALTITATGCAHVGLHHPVRSVQSPSPDISAYYDYPNHAPVGTLQQVSERRTYRESVVQFPLSVSGFEPTEPTVEFEWFQSKRPGRRAAILFNPILGGDYPLERGICRYLAGHGFHVAMVHRKTLKVSPDQPPEHLELLLRQGVIRIRQIVDWMALQSYVDPDRMGSFGISMGGMASVMTAAVEPRLRAHLVALAGGGIPDILVTSKDRLLTKPRRRYLEHHHLDLPTMERLLRDHIRTDPIRLAPSVDPNTVLLFIAVFDRTIGTQNAFRLRQALGNPETVFIPAGHYTAYLYLPYLKWISARYFCRALR